MSLLLEMHRKGAIMTIECLENVVMVGKYVECVVMVRMPRNRRYGKKSLDTDDMVR